MSIGYWKFLNAWWSDDATEADYPGSPDGHVPTLQADGTVKWAEQAGGLDVIVEDGEFELLFDDATGDVLYESGTSGGAGSSEEATVAATQYVATTGDDTTGDGTSGLPYLTVAKALSRLPADLGGEAYTITVADGTYAEGLDFTRFHGGSITVVGDVGTPANVSFTGTTTRTLRNASSSTGINVQGDVAVTLQGVRVNATAVFGYSVSEGARLIFDRCASAGTLTYGLVCQHQGYVEFRGDCTLAGWSAGGVLLGQKAFGTYTSTGTLTLTGPGSAGTGFHVGEGSTFGVYSPTGLDITVTGVQIGFNVGLCSIFAHIAATATITVDNISTPGSSIGVLCTDNSSWSTNQAVVMDHLSVDYQQNSGGYIESSGSRTLTSIGANTANGTAVQGGFVYLP